MNKDYIMYFFILMPYFVIYLTKFDVAAYVSIILSGIATLVLMNSMVIGVIPNTLLNATTLLVGLPMVVIIIGSIVYSMFLALNMKEFRINVLVVLKYVVICSLIGIIFNIIYVAIR